MKKAIIEILEGLAIYYRAQITPTQFAMYAEDLAHLTPEQLIHACREYRKNPAHKFFPLPAELMAIVKPIETELDLGQEVASKVIGAVSKFGSYRGEEARTWIGEIGWECAKRMGGWVTICAELTEENKGTFFAQIRGLAQTLNRQAKAGTLDQPRDFAPAIEANQIRELISDFSKKTATPIISNNTPESEF